VSTLDFIDARALDDALTILGERGDEVTVLAGGTDVVVALLAGDLSSRALLHVRRIPELHGIEAAERTLIGAATTHWSLATDPHICAEHAAVAEAALTVGGRQTQNVGTIAGNIVNASPAADLVPALLVADGRVHLSSSGGDRELPLGEFIVDRKRTAREPGELVVGVDLERPSGSTGEAYVKLGRRSAMEVALVGAAARLTLADDGAIATARLALCSVGPVPFRVDEAERALVGRQPSPELFDEAGAAAEAEARPIDDVRSPADYRRRVVPHLVRRALEIALSRAQA
jgi:aerobic carbon-monoxide dehydrogenase medium subunit